MNKLPNLPSDLFSPARIAYIGYIVLVSVGKLDISYCCFFLVSVIFLIIEILHNDYLRIILNGKAKNKVK